MNWILASLLALAAPALAAPPPADTFTPRLGLVVPATGTFTWGVKVNADWSIIDSSVAALGKPNTYISSNTFKAPVLLSGTSVQLTGANGYITGQSSISTSGGFFGDGSHLTGIPSTASISGSYLPLTGGTVAGDISARNLTATYGVSGATGSFSSGVTVSSLTTTATGNTQHAVRFSTGVIFTVSNTGITWEDGTVSTTAARPATSGGGHKFTTATVSGTSATSPYLFPQRSTASFDTAAFELIDDSAGDATIIKVKGYQVIATTEVYPNGTSTSATLGPCVSNSSATWRQGNNRTLICFGGGIDASGETYFMVGVLLDGAFLPGYSSAKGHVASYVNSSVQTDGSFCALTPVLSAGEHNACFTMARAQSVTLGVPANASLDSTAMLSIIELPSGGNGFAAPSLSRSSGTTDLDFNSSVFTTVAGSTATVTVKDGQQVQVKGSFFFSDQTSTAHNVRMRVIQNGAYVGAATGNCANQLYSSTLLSPCPIDYVTGPLSSGTYHFAAQVASPDAGPVTARLEGDIIPWQFSAEAVVNAPGTGDVSSNGNTAFTGINTHAGRETFSCIPGGYTFYSSHTFTAAGGSTVAISGVAGDRFSVEVDIGTKTVTGDIPLRVNGDSGANYRWSYRGYISGIGSTDNSASGTNQIYLYDGGGHDIGDSWYLKASLIIDYGEDTKTVLVRGNSDDVSATNIYGGMTSETRYRGASPGTTLNFVTTAGTITGKISVSKYCWP